MPRASQKPSVAMAAVNAFFYYLTLLNTACDSGSHLKHQTKWHGRLLCPVHSSPFMATYFHKGAAISDWRIESASSRLLTSSSVRRWTAISSVLSRCYPVTSSTSRARKQWVRLFMVPVLADIVIKCSQLPPAYPVSSLSSRCAADI